MAVRFGAPRNPDVPDETTLREALVAELRLGEASTNPEPSIIVETPHRNTKHLFAIWSKFEQVEQLVRSRILLDAYKQVFPNEYLKVTVAMGLTPEEAKRMNIA